MISLTWYDCKHYNCNYWQNHLATREQFLHNMLNIIKQLNKTIHWVFRLCLFLFISSMVQSFKLKDVPDKPGVPDEDLPAFDQCGEDFLYSRSSQLVDIQCVSPKNNRFFPTNTANCSPQKKWKNLWMVNVREVTGTTLEVPSLWRPLCFARDEASSEAW